ncbi:hypothetical protein GBA52_023440 [Prunus armeniaca]|nr:hypothetical protein GBA52_023440 [Prunus armeniaca]
MTSLTSLLVTFPERSNISSIVSCCSLESSCLNKRIDSQKRLSLTNLLLNSLNKLIRVPTGALLNSFANVFLLKSSSVSPARLSTITSPAASWLEICSILSCWSLGDSRLNQKLESCESNSAALAESWG